MAGGFRSRAKGDSSPRDNRGKRVEPMQRSRPEQHKKGRANSARTDTRKGKNTGGGFDVTQVRGVDKPRVAAYDVVRRVAVEDAFANLVLPKLLRTLKLTGRDAAFATELTYGTLRCEGLVDSVIADCSSRPLKDIAPEVLTALRLGAYQVLFMRVEDHAAVDTTVRLVEAVGQGGAKGFANAIMRSITRKSVDEWIEKLRPQSDDVVASLAFEYAHPEWIARSIARALGTAAEDELATALAADSQRPIVHLVARPGEMSAEELALITGCEEGKYSPYAVYLDSGDPGALEPVRQGFAAVQDEGSQLIARALAEAPVEGEDSGRWLDLCAGPGGKAALLGALARIDAAKVDAIEIAPHRARLIEKTVNELPVTVKVADGRNPGLDPGYDRVLVDAPCSGLGALRRRPEARWRKTEAELKELTDLQFELLQSAVALTRPGGVVVYSTCSPDLRETRAIVDRAVADLGVTELPAANLVPDMGDVGEHLSVQMWPHRHGTDAMFFSVLRV